AIDKHCVILGHGDAACMAEYFQAGFVEVNAYFWINDSRVSDHCQVIQECRTTLTKVWRLNRSNLQGLANRVDDQSLQGFAFDVFGDNQGWLVGFRNLFQQWKEVRERRNLVANQQDLRIIQNRMRGFFLGCEVWRQVALVKGNTFGDVHAGLNRLGFLDGYDTIFAHLVHSASDHLADLRITGGHGSNLRDFRRRVHRGRTLLQLFYCLFCSSRDTAVELNWVSSRSYVAQAFKNQSLCQQSSGRGAITSVVVGLGGNGLHQLRAEVFKRILNVDITRDGHAIISHGWAAERLRQHYVATTWAERDFHCVGESIYAALDALAGFLIKCNQLCHVWLNRLTYFSITASRSRADSSKYSSPLYFSSVPPYLEKITVSPSATPTGVSSPLSFARPGPTAITVASCGFSFA